MAVRRQEKKNGRCKAVAVSGGSTVAHIEDRNEKSVIRVEARQLS